MPAQYRMKAHCPGSRGCLGHEFICICSTSVTNIGGKLSKLKLWTRIYIGINERRCTSWQNHLKMWSIYWVMSFKALDTAECLLRRYQWKAIVRLQNAWLVWSLNESIVTLLIRPVTYWCTDYWLDYWVQEEDSKWEQMIYLWRGLILKQFLQKWTYRSPLDIKP